MRVLYTATLRRTAAIVWQWCYVNNLRYLNATVVAGTDSRLTTVTWPLNIRLYLTKTKLESYLRTILCSHLCCVWSVLLRTTETHLTG